MTLRTAWRVYRQEPTAWRDFGRDYMSADLARQVLDQYRTLFPDCRYIARRVRVRQITNPRTQA